jgi:hypothetical protein
MPTVGTTIPTKSPISHFSFPAEFSGVFAHFCRTVTAERDPHSDRPQEG